MKLQTASGDPWPIIHKGMPGVTMAWYHVETKEEAERDLRFIAEALDVAPWDIYIGEREQNACIS